MPLENKYEDDFTRIERLLTKLSKSMERERKELNKIRFEQDISEEARILVGKAISTIADIERAADLGATSIGGSLKLYKADIYKKRH